MSKQGFVAEEDNSRSIVLKNKCLEARNRIETKKVRHCLQNIYLVFCIVLSPAFSLFIRCLSWSLHCPIPDLLIHSHYPSLLPSLSLPMPTPTSAPSDGDTLTEANTNTHTHMHACTHTRTHTHVYRNRLAISRFITVSTQNIVEHITNVCYYHY